ncbi:hypothetical protein A464_4006 [Salmonella bongori N268-08]|uniref:Uncharacterized protein n=1 Tax=Salmonella bongori N268-08 TaxID=1197719 RepID=S5NEY0_SALBN|nr:hypothetical protein A464_4006 [Salmonella bongori N268-08]
MLVNILIHRPDKAFTPPSDVNDYLMVLRLSGRQFCTCNLSLNSLKS